MLPGFNTDFKYKGQVYHAQTEDNGVNNPVVVTLLYIKGTILSSKKFSYKELLEKGSYEKDLMELMKGQHRDIMKEVLTGKYETPAPEPQNAEEETVAAALEGAPGKEAPAAVASAEGGPKSLDVAIMEFLDSFETGTLPDN